MHDAAMHDAAMADAADEVRIALRLSVSCQAADRQVDAEAELSDSQTADGPAGNSDGEQDAEQGDTPAELQCADGMRKRRSDLRHARGLGVAKLQPHPERLPGQDLRLGVRYRHPTDAQPPATKKQK
jgi:hypothetical protein